MLDIFATIRKWNKITLLLEYINIVTKLNKIVAILFNCFANYSLIDTISCEILSK